VAAPPETLEAQRFPSSHKICGDKRSRRWDNRCPMPDRDVEEFARQLLEQLEQVGAPEGVWLVRVDQVRAQLREADALLLNLHDAIVRRAEAEREVPS